MKKYIGNMTVEIWGENAADAIQRLINPTIPGTQAEITAMGVHPAYEDGLDAESGYSVPTVAEPQPVPNEHSMRLEEEEPAVRLEADEEDCGGCPDPSEPMPLPDDFPFVGTLRREGETLDSVILRIQNGTINDVKGVGTTAAGKITAYLVKSGRLPAEEKEVPADPTPEAPEPQQNDTPEASEPGPAPAEDSTVDTTEVRKALAEVARVKQLPALKKLLEGFGATGLGDLKTEDYPAALAKAKELLADA